MSKQTTKRALKGGKRASALFDWPPIDALTDVDIHAASAKDEDAMLPLPGSPPMRAASPVKQLRFSLKLSQEGFCNAFGIPLATLRDWERHVSEPDATALAYLKVIAAKPTIVRKVLEAA